ncbi:MAG: hypothetical protein EXS35_11225 [Pedosphaera sp.]|nr:hypothetical protein [Pedosphaera sp.]
MNATFKQAQLLPALTAEMRAGENSPTTFCPLCARPGTREQRATERNPSRQLPRPRADKSNAERALFAVLALSSLFGLGWAVALMNRDVPELVGVANLGGAGGRLSARP